MGNNSLHRYVFRVASGTWVDDKKFFFLKIWDFPGSSASKESARNVGDLGLIPGSGRSPGEGNGNSLQYSCLENSMDKEPGGIESLRGASWATDHGVTESDTTERLPLSLKN